MAENNQNTGYLILDGGMGTMLQKAGIGAGGQGPDLLSLANPKAITAIHAAYLDAGADLVYTNTFGANRLKTASSGFSVEQIVTAATKAALDAARVRGKKVALDIGPLGELLEPVGTLTFEQAYDLFAEMVCAGAAAGADLVVIETMTDLYEVKAAVLAAKENCALPVWASMTFEESGRTFTGCSVEAMAATLEGLGVDAVGINCSLGPVEILPIAKRLCAATNLPVFIKPNAGLPDPRDGSYNITPELFCEQMRPYLELGIFAMGGCCGTTPDYIRLLAGMCKDKTPPARAGVDRSVVCTPTRVQEIDGLTVVGERINPTGKKLFKQALADGNMDYILSQALSQKEAGAQILDVNVGLPGLDEPAMMERVVKSIQTVCDLPLQLDSSDPDALARGLRIYNGKPLVNSVNGEQKVLDAVLPLCKKYGAAVVGLTLDENGIPMRADERFEIAQRIVAACDAAGIPRRDIYIDCLTLTASAQQKEVAETLKAIRMVKEQLGVRTVLGVSNISFGLPCRELLNQSFLTMAAAAGLDLAIVNPNVESMMDAVRAADVLLNRDKKAARYLAAYAGAQPAAKTATKKEITIEDAIYRGFKTEAKSCTQELLAQMGEMQVVNERLIPALDKVGADFETGRLFLPQLLQAAAAAQAAFDVVKSSIAAKGKPPVSKGKILIATVKGDIHDIGKNIVKVILENYGYEMIDLGRDVAPERIVRTALEKEIVLVGLSALMTTTLGSMEETIRQLRAAKPDCKTFVGGAVLTPSYAKKIGADYYAKDAKQAVDIAREVFGG